MEQSIISLNDRCPVIKNGNDEFLFRELERVDLCLQRYALRERDRLESHVLEGFLLSDDELEERAAMPEGVPHWMSGKGEREDYTDYQEELPGGRFAKMVNRFRLTSLETDILLLGLLPYFDSRYFHLFAALQRSAGKNLPSFELVQALFEGELAFKPEHYLCLLPQSPLLKFQLITVKKTGEQLGEEWAQTLFVTSTGVFHYLTGNEYLSSPLSACAKWYQANQGAVQDSVLKALSALKAQDDTCEDGMHPVLILEGTAEGRQLSTLRSAASHREQSILFLKTAQLPEISTEAELVMGEAAREVRMRDAILVLTQTIKKGEETENETWTRQLRQPGLRVVVLRNRTEGSLRFEGMPQLVMEMPGLSHRERESILRRALPRDFAKDIDVAGFSRRFSFTPDSLPYILQEARGYRNLRGDTGTVSSADLSRALRMHARKNFGRLAQHRVPQRTFDDLVVSGELREQLTEILLATRYRDTVLEYGFSEKIGYGTGISALFCGDSGTGKTMAAEVIAGHLEVDLIKVDLSTVVDKYIGETEKNLSRIFDRAEDDASILFFDEADALFGKRSAVKDAKDRNANIEVAYLLQRLENHPGLVILSTNNRNHLDDAFSRRFTFIARFDFPDASLREEMWRRIWPQSITLASDVNFTALAGMAQLTGANIRNIALHSAWLAAEDTGRVIYDRHIRLALKRELAKVGRITY